MIPATVSYTGLELNPREMAWWRIVDGPFPAEWVRIVVNLVSDLRPLRTWLLENVNGRFGIVSGYPKAAIYFEDDHDAILFRLKDGEEAWRDESTSPF